MHIILSRFQNSSWRGLPANDLNQWFLGLQSPCWLLNYWREFPSMGGTFICQNSNWLQQTKWWFTWQKGTAWSWLVLCQIKCQRWYRKQRRQQTKTGMRYMYTKNLIKCTGYVWNGMLNGQVECSCSSVQHFQLCLFQNQKGNYPTTTLRHRWLSTDTAHSSYTFFFLPGTHVLWCIRCQVRS